MSYDVSFFVESSTGSTVSVGEFNYTSNCSAQWRAAGIEISEWHGQLASDVRDELATGIQNVQADRARFRAMNPPNGWGDTDSMLSLFLEPMLRLCREWPESRIDVWR